MLNQDIPEEFYGTVEKIARQVQNKWKNLDWEDIRQETWVYLLENREEFSRLLSSEDAEKRLRRIVNQRAVSLQSSDEISWGAYHYTPAVVRAMLRVGYLSDPSLGTMSEQEDLQKSFEKLEGDNTRYAHLIHQAYTDGDYPEEETDSRALRRGVDRLTQFMNWHWVTTSGYRFPVRDEEPFYEMDIDTIIDKIDKKGY